MTHRLKFIPLLLMCFAAATVFGQSTERKRVSYPPEVQSDPYLPNTNKRTGPAYRSDKNTITRTTASTVTTVQVNIDGSGLNILGDAANEPSIAINPLNPNEIIIGWRQFDNVLSNFRQAGWAYSADAGVTWNFPGVIEPGVFRSDPVLDYNANGEIFYNSLTSIAGPTFLCKVFKSTTGGATWNTGTNAYGGDKQWMAIDRTGGAGQGNIYSFWTSVYSSCAPYAFTRSSNNNVSYESCTAIDGDPALGTMAISATGELYICGASPTGDLVVSKSLNAQVVSSVIAWNPAVSVWLDGDINIGVSVNPAGLLGQANIDVDISNGPGQGNVYVFATVTRQSFFDPGDGMFVKSTDGGLTWSAPQRINTDSSQTNTQWMGTMSVAPNGRIDIVWLDTRDEVVPGSDGSKLYYSYSIDQGNTWSANESISPLFDPHVGYPNQDKMGDYFDMISDNTGAHLAWAATMNSEQDVYYTHIIPNIPAGINSIASKISATIIPNPTADGNFVIAGIEKSFDLEIYNLQGIECRKFSGCKSNILLDISNEKAGIYILKIKFSDDSVVIKKLIRL
jgi:hypothetical protein